MNTPIESSSAGQIGRSAFELGIPYIRNRKIVKEMPLLIFTVLADQAEAVAQSWGVDLDSLIAVALYSWLEKAPTKDEGEQVWEDLTEDCLWLLPESAWDDETNGT